MVMRGDWLMRETVLCVHHHHPLVPLWSYANPRDRFNIGARLAEIEDDIMTGGFDQPLRKPTNYDLWLDRRLDTGEDETWFSDQTVYAVTTFCRLLGDSLIRTEVSEGISPSHNAHALGFNASSSGPAATRAILDRIAAEATGPLDEPQKAFGDLYRRMSGPYLTDPAFDELRRLLRDCILDHWPISAGEAVLGQIVPERRFHSVRTAAQEAGVSVKLLDQYLIEAGAVSVEDMRPPARKLFDARAYAELLLLIPTLVGPIAMRRAMGATEHELMALEKDGALSPRTSITTVKSPWCVADGLELIARLEQHAEPVQPEDPDWEPLLMSRKRSGVAMTHLLEAIESGALAAGRRVGEAGFHAIVVRGRDVFDLKENTLLRIEHVDEPLPGVMSAAAFGRSVGLRNNGTFLALVEAGLTPAQRIVNPKTMRPQYQVSEQDIAAFHRRYVTLTTLSSESGVHTTTLRGRLSAAEIVPFSCESQVFRGVYLRTVVGAGLK